MSVPDSTPVQAQEKTVAGGSSSMEEAAAGQGAPQHRHCVQNADDPSVVHAPWRFSRRTPGRVVTMTRRPCY
jgi:hypothetical protein